MKGSHAIQNKLNFVNNFSELRGGCSLFQLTLAGKHRVVFSFYILFVGSCGALTAQHSGTDSFKRIFLQTKDDSVLYKAANQLYDYYEELSRDSALYYAGQCVWISRKNNKKLNEAYSLSRKAYQELNMGQYAEALKSLLEGFEISESTDNDKLYWQIEPLREEKSKRLFALSCVHHIYALLMWRTQNVEQEIIHFKEAKRIAVEINSPARSVLGSLNLGRIYLESGKLDSAWYYENEAEEIAIQSGRKKYMTSILHFKGLICLGKRDTARALHYFKECIQSGIEQHNLDGMVRGYHALADYFISKKNKDSSLYFSIQELEIFKNLGATTAIDYHIGIAYMDLSQSYRIRGQLDSAYKYLSFAQKTNDSINRNKVKSLAEFQKLTLSELQRSQNIVRERTALQNKVRTTFLLSGIAVLMLLAIIFYRNNLQKQKAKAKIEQAYEELKSTQSQLIQSEKMASMGQLTAGIAHEIQNPLNFVNNFSEINKELLDELKGERGKAKGERNEQLEDQLVNNIKENEEKINYHGKRADSIVKGMLQHSRISTDATGLKEPTDINALVKEYFRLSYHAFQASLRAKESAFNTTMKTNYDGTLGVIQIIPQDIGRVLLNIFNNAFYSVNDKLKNLQPGQEYEPAVSVSTRKLEKNKIEIRIRDNGMGIPQHVLDKIFQPFFTTKPTGQGTGLGLSLSYDIIKAHSGEFKVESVEGEYAEFIIILPL